MIIAALTSRCTLTAAACHCHCLPRHDGRHRARRAPGPHPRHAAPGQQGVRGARMARCSCNAAPRCRVVRRLLQHSGCPGSLLRASWSSHSVTIDSRCSRHTAHPAAPSAWPRTLSRWGCCRAAPTWPTSSQPSQVRRPPVCSCCLQLLLAACIIIVRPRQLQAEAAAAAAGCAAHRLPRRLPGGAVRRRQQHLLLLAVGQLGAHDVQVRAAAHGRAVRACVPRRAG